MSTQTRVRIADIDLGSYLLAEGLVFVGIENSSDPRRKLFAIEGDSERLDLLTTSFARGEATVRVVAFTAAKRKLRDALVRGVTASA